MIINIKYNINENIKYIDKNPRMFFKACPCCNGLGYIIGADNIKYNCPFCKGEKETFYKMEMEEIKKVGTIKNISVYIEEDSNKPKINYGLYGACKTIDQEDIISKYKDRILPIYEPKDLD